MRHLKKHFLALGFLALFLCGTLWGCGTRPAPATSPDTSEPPLLSTPDSVPDHLLFNNTSYPLDVSELIVSNLADLSQLRYAAQLATLIVIVYPDAPMDWSHLDSLGSLTSLQISCSGGDIDLSPLASCGALESIRLDSSSPLGELVLPAAPELKDVSVSLADTAQFLDFSACQELETLDISASTGPSQLRLGAGLGRMAFSGFTPDLTDLGKGPEALSLNIAADLSPLQDCLRLRELSLSGEGWDLSLLAGTALEVLRLHDCVSSELASLLAPASLRTVQLSDRTLTDLSPLDALEQVETLLLLVSPDQPARESLWNTPITAGNAELLDLLETALPTEPLARFLSRGGTLFLIPDLSRI